MILHVEGPTASTGIPVSGNNVWRSGPLRCFRQNWWMVPIHPLPVSFQSPYSATWQSARWCGLCVFLPSWFLRWTSRCLKGSGGWCEHGSTRLPSALPQTFKCSRNSTRGNSKGSSEIALGSAGVQPISAGLCTMFTLDQRLAFAPLTWRSFG